MTIREAIDIMVDYVDALEFYNRNFWLIDEPFTIWHDDSEVSEARALLKTANIEMTAVRKSLNRRRANEPKYDYKAISMEKFCYIIEQSSKRFVDRVSKMEKDDECDLPF